MRKKYSSPFISEFEVKLEDVLYGSDGDIVIDGGDTGGGEGEDPWPQDLDF